MSDVSSNSDTVVANNDDTVVSKDCDISAETSVKHKLINSKSTSKPHSTAASKSKAKPNIAMKKTTTAPTVGRSRQLPPRPQPKVPSAPKPALTPTKKNAPKKACSTPTSEDMTISDMTLDASCISVVNR